MRRTAQLIGLLLALLPSAAWADTVVLRSDGAAANDPIQWTWAGTELGDQSDATYATTNKGNRLLRSSIGNDAVYAGCTIHSVEVGVRAAQTIGNELLDYGLYDLGTDTDYLTGSPVTPSGGSVFADFTNLWTTRPWGGSWVDTDVDALVVTAQSVGNGKWDGEEQLAELFVTVDYTCTGNTPPSVTIVTPSDASAFNLGDTVNFSGTASDTEDGDLTASLSWNSSIDGLIGTGGSFSRNDLSVGSHTITASVSDSGSLQGQDQITITVNGPPIVTIITPSDASTFNLGDTVNFSGTASDPEDGDLTASLSWNSSIDGLIGTGGSFSRNDLSVGSHTITASVTDSGSLQGQDQITITVNGPPIVTIITPSDASTFNLGDTVNFSGTASDTEDGDLTASLSWNSSIDGLIGTGGSFSRNDLSVGSHTITASVSDSGLLQGQDQITITVSAVANDVTPNPPAANIDGCNQITVSVTFTGDANGNSSTLFERSPNGTDSWAPVVSCGAGNGVVSGPSPRTCIDTTVADNSINYYRVDFTDGDGVNGIDPSNPIGPFDTTPFCTDDSTTVGTAEAEASTCNQITVLARFTGDGNRDGSVLVEYSLAGQAVWNTGCASASGASPRQCVIPELDPSTSYDIQITFTDPDGVAPDTNLDTNNELITPTPSTLSTTACGADTAAPTVLFLAPTHDAILGGTDSIKVQVFDADLANLTVQYSVDSDGDAGLTPVSQNTNYACGTDCAVYEFSLDTTALGQGSHFLTIKASDTEGNVARVSQAFRVNNDTGKAAGDGLLLRRTHGSQLCIDCHNLPTHSSQSTSDRYGNWAVDCMACHTPHQTTNIFVIRPQVRTPNSGLRDVRFESTTGAVADSTTGGTASYANEDNAVGDDGPCQVCHTRTQSTSGDARWRNTAGGGNADTHYTSVATQRCTNCHTHEAGFSGAGGACDSCHFAPPAVGKHGVHDEVGTTPTDYANLTPHTTPTQYGFACNECHSGTHFDDSNQPHTVEVVFDNTQDPKNPTGTYAADAGSRLSDPGVNGEGWYWSDGSCSNLYCHSNAEPLGGSNVLHIVTWDQPGALACSDCHSTQASDDAGGTATDLSDTHGKHIQSTPGETGSYTFTCDECHAATIQDSPADPWNLTSADFSIAAGEGKVQHVDGQKDVLFSTAATSGGVDQSGGSYDGGTYKCSGTYCHSQGTSTVSFLAPNDPDLVWIGGVSDCRSCHSGDATGTPAMDSGAHEFHVNNATVIGTNYECAACHDLTVGAGNNELITGIANHVDGAKEISGARVDDPYSSPTCTATYCHSSGQAPAPATTSFEYYTANWNTGPALDCKGCHGQHTENAFTSLAGEPNYTNDGAGQPDANSHEMHVSSALDCTKCHNATTANGTQILSSAPHTDQIGAGAVCDGGTNDGNPCADINGDTDCPSGDCKFVGFANVVIAPTYDTGDPNYLAGSKTCQNIACHRDGSPQWGAGSLLCLDCHHGPDGGTLGDATPNGVGDEWNNAGVVGPGHGTAGTGGFTSALQGCDYCHELDASHEPTDATNPYRLRFSSSENTLCLQCHLQGDLGISQNSRGTALTSINSSVDVDTAHAGTKHATGEGGGLCWDCHDPHGVPSNLLMVKSQVSISTVIDTVPEPDVSYGVPLTTGSVTFTARADYTDFVQTGGGTPRQGMCQACHDPGKTGTESTKYWRWDGTDDPDGQGGNAPITSAHNATPGKPCTDCHFHNDNFKGAGGDCLSCHGDGSGALARRAVETDFSKNSHHVGASVDADGNPLFAQPNMGGALTNYDCVVCHAEGRVNANGETETVAAQHGGDSGTKTIDLRNTDSSSTFFSYDKDAIATDISGSGGGIANWMSGNTVWETQTKTALDPFCLSCHDTDGASVTFNDGTDESRGFTGTAHNPFADSAITNEYDQQARGNVVNIRNRVDAYVDDTNTSITPIDREAGGEPRTTDGRPDPTQGTYSRHAIRGDGSFGSVSVYGSSQIPANRWVAWASGNPGGWNDQSVMGCADCHTTDGANTTAGNAHGSNTEYLLKDADGLATTEPAFDIGTATASKINCYKCHSSSWYSRQSGQEHTDNNSDWIFTADQTGSAGRIGGNGNILGLPCTNCHGGAPTFGTIHGTSDLFDINLGWACSDSGDACDPADSRACSRNPEFCTVRTERPAYRFMNGASLRFYDPQDWNASSVTCYTLSDPDSWGGCTQHGAGGSGKPWTRPVTRDIQY